MTIVDSRTHGLLTYTRYVEYLKKKTKKSIFLNVSSQVQI